MLDRRQSFAILASGLLFSWGAASLSAETPVPPATAAERFVPSDEFQKFITDLAREHVPENYEKRKNWGNTRRVQKGLDVRFEGLRLDTKRIFKEEEHGVWQWYTITNLEPDKHFTVRIEQVREATGGRVICDLSATAKLHCFGRQSQWDRGVQLYSVSADAETQVKLLVSATIRPRLDPKTFPPDVVLLTEVTHADLEIHDFRLQRVGPFDGPVIRSLSKTVREVLEDKIAADREKLVTKINEQIGKQQDKLRLRWSDLLETPWGNLAEKLTPMEKGK